MNIPEFIYTVLLKPTPLRAVANAVIRALLPAQLNYRGLRLALNPDDPVVSGALTFGLYETGEVRFFERILRPGLTVVDVGANMGLYTALADRAVGPTGRVIALEPEPETFGFLRQTIAANAFTNVELHQLAASATPGAARLFRSPRFPLYRSCPRTSGCARHAPARGATKRLHSGATASQFVLQLAKNNPAWSLSQKKINAPPPPR